MPIQDKLDYCEDLEKEISMSTFFQKLLKFTASIKRTMLISLNVEFITSQRQKLDIQAM